MSAMWRIVSGGARSCECGCSNVAGVLCPKFSLRQIGDAICPLQLLCFQQSTHDSFGGPSRQRWSNHACATDLYPYLDPITCTCTRRQDTASACFTIIMCRISVKNGIVCISANLSM